MAPRSSPTYRSPAGVLYRGGPQFGKIPRAGSVEFSVRFQANSILRLVREIEGKFQPANGRFLKAVEEVNIRMAMTVQAGMAEELQRRVAATGRPQDLRTGKDAHKQGALAEALRDPENRFVNASGFIVGRPDWLNRSPVRRYWRRIEEGGASFQAKGWFFPRGVYTRSAGGAAPAKRGSFQVKDGRVSYKAAPVAGGSHKQVAYPPSSQWAGHHARFPQDRDNPRAFWVEVGPFPAYRYSKGGARALANINKEDWYSLALLRAGIKVTPRMVRSWAPVYVQ